MFRNLELKSKKLRLDTFKKFIETGEAHLGGSFSMIEILIFLFFKVLNKNDKFILSKSHASFPLCLMLRERGYKPKLTTHLELDTKNQIHCTTGSLGHGLPIAAGMAFARKIFKKKGNIYVLISDGECQEGTTWETLLIASAKQLPNLKILIDYNKIQALSKLEDALPLNSLKSKIKAFNCNVIDVKDGHSFKNISASFFKKFKNNKPTVIIFNTIKGKGIKEFEDDPVWHARKLNKNDIQLGLERLRGKIK
jgi:transketolase